MEHLEVIPSPTTVKGMESVMTDDKDYGYEMLDCRIVIQKSIHISCLEQTIKQAKEFGILKEMNIFYYQDHSPKFGEVK
jgi:hypothetical protein